MPARRLRHGSVLGLVALVAPVAAPVAAAGQPAAALRGRASAAAVSLRLSDLYDVSVYPGSWVPLVATVADNGLSGLRGELVVRSPVLPMSQLSPENCYINGLSTICSFTGAFSYGTPAGYYASTGTATSVTYEVPLDLAPGTVKQVLAYVLAEAQQGSVQAEVRASSGAVLAQSVAHVAVAAGALSPAVLLVTDDPDGVSSLVVPTPGGPPAAVQAISPASVPSSSAAMSTFAAVAIEEADLSALSPSQFEALTGYVESGGALVLSGGLAWRGAAAGWPAGFLPARVTGTGSAALTGLARLLGVAPPGGAVVYDRLALAPGAMVPLSEGNLALVASARRGNGEVMLSGIDPLAVPLADWPGDGQFLSRLFAPAFQGHYYGEAGPAVSGPGPLIPAATPVATMSELGPSRTALMSPTVASSALAAYLAQMPGEERPPPYLLGVMLLVYAALAGPLCYAVLRRLRHRELLWVALPGLALVAGVLAYLTGAGVDRHPLFEGAQVTRLAPGSSLGQVTTLGAVYLPRGGAAAATVPTSGLVTDLGAGGGAELTVTHGRAPGTAALTVSGPAGSLGGWATSSDTVVLGSVNGAARETAASLNGTVVNHLPMALENAYIVSGWGDVVDLGRLGPGSSAYFSFPVSSPDAVAATNYPTTLSGSLLSSVAQVGSASARQQAALEGLYELASAYSGTNGAGPILVAFTSRPLPRPGAPTSALTGVAEAVVVPFAPSAPPGTAIAGLSPQLVASQGSLQGVDLGLGSGTPLVLAQHGHFDYQFLLPGRAWSQLSLDLGPLSGPSVPGPGMSAPAGLRLATGSLDDPVSAATTRDFSLSIFNYATGRWDVLPAREANGLVVATVRSPGAHIGPGGAVQVRLTATAGRLAVLGAVPSLAAAPSLTPTADQPGRAAANGSGRALPQVSRPHAVVAKESGRVVGHHDGPVLKHVSPVGEPQCLCGVLLD